MIRYITLGALLLTLGLILYLPSRYPPDIFLQTLRAEHDNATSVWGSGTAAGILDRSLSVAATGFATSIMVAPESNSDRALVKAMAMASRGLVNAAYLRSLDALLLLVVYRLAALAEWLPWLLPFGIAALADGAVLRHIRGHEFRQHDPEVFGLAATAIALVTFSLLASLVIPWDIAAWIYPTAIVIDLLLSNRAIGSYHR